MFRFAQSDYLYALLAIPFFLLLFLIMLYQRKRLLRKIADISLLKNIMPDTSKSSYWIKFILISLGFASLVIALANPQIGTKLEEVKREGVDIMIAIDVSNSMKSEDIRPSRIERSKQAVSRLIDKLQNDRIGIIVFAGTAFVQLPITNDFAAAKLFLSTIEPDMVGTQGTAIGAAIELASKSFDKKDKKYKTLMIITDGENHEDDALGEAEKAAEQGIIVHTIGMGSIEGGPIPIYRNNQAAGFLKDKDGNTVITKLNDKMLKEVADAGKGKFVRASSAQDGIQILLDEINKMEKKNYGSKIYTDYANRFQIFLMVALFLLLLEFSISDKKNHWWGKINFFAIKNKPNYK
ncbi:MAG: VWA domain-containing protein [Cytophagales bacterium]|nr:MAG: VWA domain-containing protein [Cytophagales bacterium]